MVLETNGKVGSRQSKNSTKHDHEEKMKLNRTHIRHRPK